MKIAVVGPGALGCLLAVFFREAGEDVSLVDYRPERARYLQEQGILLKTLDGRQQVVRVPVALAPEIGPVDLTIIAVKTYQTDTTNSELAYLMGGGGITLTLQNGLGNLETIAQAVGPERLLAGIIYVGATRPRDGEVIYAGLGPIYLGAPRGSHVAPAEIQEAVAAFRQAGLECQARENIEAMLWEKLLVNVGINPLTALLRVPNGALLDLPQAWELAVAAATEAAAVARAAGLILTTEPEASLRQVCRATAANRSSMLQDILADRPTEIEALNAQVATRGAALGVPTPINHLLTRLIRALSQSASFRLKGV
ncbi:MAG: 2-dehydropantoate 2-reductase [Thermodesulfobacteriota bacterium]